MNLRLRKLRILAEFKFCAPEVRRREKPAARRRQPQVTIAQIRASRSP